MKIQHSHDLRLNCVSALLNWVDLNFGILDTLTILWLQIWWAFRFLLPSWPLEFRRQWDGHSTQKPPSYCLQLLINLNLIHLHVPTMHRVAPSFFLPRISSLLIISSFNHHMKSEGLWKCPFKFENPTRTQAHTWSPIGHFQVLLCLCFKTSLGAKPFIWKSVLQAVLLHGNQSHFHKNGFALRLVMKQRQKGPRKWSI